MTVNTSNKVTIVIATDIYETQTQAIGQELLNATKEKRGFFDQLRLEEKLLGWTMAHPGLRVQLFRFIDTLPALGSKAAIARHLQEYLSDPSVELPAALKGMLNFTQPDSVPGQMSAATMAGAIEALAQKYIAGENIPKALKTIEALRRDRLAFTLDLLGEAVITETEAQAYLERYLQLLEQLTTAARNWGLIPQIDQAGDQALAKVQVSVKLTAFYSQFDPLDEQGSKAQVKQRARLLLAKAQELGAAVHFDMEQYQYKGITLATLKELLLEPELCDRTDIGITIQAYLRDSYQDAADLIAWAKQRKHPVTIRLVKGAYWDQETIRSRQKHWDVPVYSDKAETDANFEQITRLLLENHAHVYTAIASHNVRSQARAIAIAKALQVPPRAFEMQVLYGMGDQLAKAIAKQGYRVRVYCPYGDLIPGMAYLIRRLLENTANSSFLRQALEDRPAAELLAPPRPQATANNYLAPFANAPDTDYSLPAARSQAQAALAQVKSQLGKLYRPLINGQYCNTVKVIDSVNPSDPNQVVGRVGQIDLDQAEQAIAAAKAAFADWSRHPGRPGILRRAAELIEQRRAELSAWMVLETGKPIREADAEVSEAIDFCRYYAAEMERLQVGITYDVAGETNRYAYQPKGVALVISPWNFPLAIATGMTAAALVTGNCTLLKPAAPAAVIAAKLTEILQAAGVPAGAFQYIPSPGSTAGSYLVKHKDVHVIAFTGSQEVGCQIYAEAAVRQPGQRHLKRVIAEMGGKNAIIVDASADLDQAVQGVIQSAFGYSGQKCSACSRVIVLEPIYQGFLERLVDATRSLPVGPAELASTKVGPVIDETAQKRIQQYIAIGKTEATVALEMPSPSPGYFVGPVIFSRVPPDARIAQEEIFGPVVAVIAAADFDQALAIANETNYALTGGLFSRTPSHIDQARREFAVGNLYINRNITGAIVSRQPFGGFKLSGVGSKAGGPDYLLQFLDPKVVTENIQRQGFAPIDGL